MKVKVIRDFIDIHTKKLHPEGEIMNVSKARYAEIQKAGNFVIPALDDKPERIDEHGNEIS
ncbi:MAG TPA: hypothetical protein DCO72_01645 [Ruminococcus sp.]|nr:hypothetical protein [Ruminococcus sp.]